MLELSKSLQSKAITLSSMTIDSPTSRTNAMGEAIRPTIYFDKPVKQDKNGKKVDVPSKKSAVYTPNAEEAAAIPNCTCTGVETIKLGGTEYRFLKSALEPADLSEVRKLKGLLKANSQNIKLKAALKGFTSAYISALSLDERNIIAEAIGNLALPIMDHLRHTQTVEEDEPLFS